jgi:hypothetical protein
MWLLIPTTSLTSRWSGHNKSWVRGMVSCGRLKARDLQTWEADQVNRPTLGIHRQETRRAGKTGRRGCRHVTASLLHSASREDDCVLLYYAPYGKYYFCAVCRHLNGDGFLITAYLTDRIKKGDTVYEADPHHL